MHITAFAPWIWLGVFSAFVGRSWLVLGRLPRPYQPDPKTLGFDWHMAVVAYGLLVAAAACVAFPVVYASWRRGGTQRVTATYAGIGLTRGDRVVAKTATGRRRWLVTVYATGWCMVAVVILADPGRYWSWFLD